MTQLFTNNATSSLAVAVAVGDLSITLKTGEGVKFPAPTTADYFLVTLYQKPSAVEINYEIMRCTARSGDVLTVLRAQESTTATAYNIADPVELRATAGTLTSKQDLLVSGTNIKTVNGTTLLGTGDLVSGSPTANVYSFLNFK